MTYISSAIDNQIDANNSMANHITSAAFGIDEQLFASLNYTEDGYEAYLTALNDIGQEY